MHLILGSFSIDVRNFKLIIDLLDNFGDSMHYMGMDFNRMTADEGEEIIKTISERCSDSVRILILNDCKGSALSQLKKPFVTVNFLKFSTSESAKFIGMDMKLNKIFPKVTKLHIEHTTVSDWVFIGDSFPLLTSFKIELQSSINDDQAHILNFLKQNSQIDCLTVMDANLKFLKEAIEILPNLETLTLIHLQNDYMNGQCDAIHFETLKEVKIDAFFMDKIPDKIIFDRLVKLTIKFIDNFDDQWIQFIDKQVNKNLNMLTLFTGNLTEKYFLQIPEKLSHLLIVSIKCITAFTADNIKQFIEKSKHLSDLKMEIHMDKMEQDALKELLNDDWNIEVVNSTNQSDEVTIYLER